MSVSGFDITSTIARSIETDSKIPVQPLYGADPDILIPEIELSSDEDYKVFLEIFMSDPSDVFVEDSIGLAQKLDGFFYIFAKRAFDCVERLQNLMSVFMTTQLNGIGTRPTAPYTIGECTFWKFNPVDGIHRTASHFGGKYGIEQMVQMTMAVTKDIT